MPQSNLFGWGPDFSPRPYSPRNTLRRLAAMRAAAERRAVDLSFKRFGHWTVLKCTGHNPRRCLCRCDCGRETTVIASRLTGGFSLGCKSCRLSETKSALSPLGDFEGQFKKAQRSAKREGIVFTLTLQEYQAIAEAKSPCHYCGAPLRWERRRRGKKIQTYNLDRKNNDRAIGYCRDNVVPCCDRCNRSKGVHWTYEQFFLMTETIRGAQRQAAIISIFSNVG